MRKRMNEAVLVLGVAGEFITEGIDCSSETGVAHCAGRACSPRCDGESNSRARCILWTAV
jgi:hypothetical protein